MPCGSEWFNLAAGVSSVVAVGVTAGTTTEFSENEEGYGWQIAFGLFSGVTWTASAVWALVNCYQQNAEQLRAQAEALRVQAEQARAQNEQQRGQNELQRGQTEQQRAQVEQQRVQAEQQRVQAEQQRVQAEQQRTLQLNALEQKLMKAFQDRLDQEITQRTELEARVSKETGKRRDLEKQVEDLQRQAADSELLAKKYQQTAASLQEHATSLQAEVTELKRRLDEAKKETANL